MRKPLANTLTLLYALEAWIEETLDANPNAFDSDAWDVIIELRHEYLATRKG